MTALLTDEDLARTSQVRRDATIRHWQHVNLLLDRRVELQGVVPWPT